LLSNQILSHNDCIIEVEKTFDGENDNGQFDLQFLHMDELHQFFDEDKRGRIYECVKLCPCLLLRIIVKQDAYFFPTKLQFVQEKNQYGIGYEDIVKISDVLCDTKLRAGVEVYGIIYIPEDIDVYLPMKIYYDDYYAIFSLPGD